APKRPGWRRHLVALTFLLSLALLVIALARPTREEAAPLGPTLVLAIDTSLSMQATDVEPNRLEAAQEAADELVDSLAENVRVSLISFNGTATIQVAPTTDHESVRDAIDSLELSEFTAIGEAIFASLDAIELAEREQEAEAESDDEDDAEVEDPGSQVVVMSDGETTTGRPDVQAAQAANEAGIEVSTIAFGTQGATIDIPGQGTVDVSVNEQALEAIADSTGGEFFAATTGEELAEAFADIGGTVDSEVIVREIGTWFLGLGVALLVLTSILSLLWFSRLP
ncbi:MAG TPA: VWA domain-containing protein, partial [Acidimicrobiales bacterium]|nr:VWA domain-containing protein [Acidimicrobiales bacterium]